MNDRFSLPESIESQRLRSLRQYHLLDTEPEPEFDDIARLAATVLTAPSATVTLVDERRQWFKARVNFAVAETPREIAFCNYAIREPEGPFVVPDARQDLRFATNPLVIGPPYIRFYAGMAVITPNGFPIGSVAVMDYTPREGITAEQSSALQILAKRVTEQLRLIDAISALHLFRVSTEQISDAIAISESDPSHALLRIIYTNTAFQRLTGYEAGEIAGRSPEILFGADPNRVDLRRLDEAIRKERPLCFDAVNYRKSGEPFLAEISVSPLFDEDHVCTHWISVRRDVTEHRRMLRDAERANVLEETNARLQQEIRDREAAEQRLAFVSMHDTLTHLPNRSLLLDRINLALERARTGESLSPHVLYIDIDRFKVINDSLGHDQGDALLVRLAQRLATCVAATETLARFSDEFVIVANGNRSQLEALEFATTLLAAMNEPFHIGGERIQMTGSLGIARIDPDLHETPVEVLRDAEIAMYRSKQLERRGGFAIFEPSLRDEMMAQLRMETDLRNALDLDQLRVLYQPIVDLETERIAAVEALVRFEHPTRGLLGADSFIGVAEETGLIVPLGRWVLGTATRDVQGWRKDLAESTPIVHVNVSAMQLQESTFCDEVNEALESSGLPPEKLCLELTESALMSNFQVALEILRAMTHRGIHVAVDDFGTGYSSLSYLRRFPISAIKVDRAFISGESTSNDDVSDPAITATNAALGRTLDLDVVAEGVESARQGERVHELGCTHIQGYATGKPMNGDELLLMLATKNPLSG